MNRVYKIIPVILFIGGVFLAGRSVFYYSKGIAAKMLINSAWAETKETHAEVKPWEWADFHPVGRIEIESIGMDCVVLDKISGEALAFGPGHLSNTAKPGTIGNVVLAGHRDSHFRKLNKIKKNDLIKLESASKSSFYIVTDITPTAGDDIYWTEDTGEDVITLITCYPFNFVGKAEERYIVRGALVNSQQKG
ncbi:MAG: class D sortase [Candidatus Marinimicrobia bacterium]|nr:class D sortase [Candidatus Neomarinimicrobiota bacterium]